MTEYDKGYSSWDREVLMGDFKKIADANPNPKIMVMTSVKKKPKAISKERLIQELEKELKQAQEKVTELFIKLNELQDDTTRIERETKDSLNSNRNKTKVDIARNK